MIDRHMEKLGTTIRLELIKKIALLGTARILKTFFPLGNKESTPLEPLGISCYSLSREVIDQAGAIYRPLMLYSNNNDDDEEDYTLWTPCVVYLKRLECNYAAVLDMNGGRKGRWTIVQSDRKYENSHFQMKT